MPFVITLTGPSRCGKSEVIKLIKKISQEDFYKKEFKPVFVKKYTTRSFRSNELEVLKKGEEDGLDIKAVIGKDNYIKGIDIKKLEEEKLFAFNNLGCDLVYEQYGNRYGVRMKELYDYLKQGFSPIVILNDVRTVEDLKSALGKQCKTLFIFREIPNLEHFQRQGIERNESQITIQTRFDKAIAIYRIYIENIHIFDKLVLNVKNGHESLEKIIRQFIDFLCIKNQEFR